MKIGRDDLRGDTRTTGWGASATHARALNYDSSGRATRDYDCAPGGLYGNSE